MEFHHLRIGPKPPQRVDALWTAPSACTIEPLPGWNDHQFAIFLLQTAADIEHALLVQYLYAAYSLPPEVFIKDPATGSNVIDPDTQMPVKTTQWTGQIASIAQEEMGHLMSIQCLLRALGGPIGFDREHFPYRSRLYPFPFTLEPLTKNSLARYVLAEMPDPSLVPSSVLTPAQIQEIQERATRDTGGVAINHVGMLYDTLLAVVHRLDESAFRQDRIPYQADLNDWNANEDDDENGVKVLPIRPVGSITSLRDIACRALRIIARQGEGITPTTMPPSGPSSMDHSHFMRFLKIYKLFPDGLEPALPVATNPNTTMPPCPGVDQPLDPETALEEQKNRGGRVTNEITLLWAHLFNVRYRILLMELHHYLLLRPDMPQQKIVRDRLVSWALSEMKDRMHSSIAALAQTVLAQLDQYPFPGFKAGAPFETPYTFDLPMLGPDRWQFHRDLYEGSRAIVAELETTLAQGGQQIPDALTELQKFEDTDDGSGQMPPQGRIGFIDEHRDSMF